MVLQMAKFQTASILSCHSAVSDQPHAGRKWAYILLRNIICEEMIIQAVQPDTNYCSCLWLITPNLCSSAICMEK